jgi:hypothetical protein
MSDMLEQAIIDADALKEAALKNAEELIIEKYSHEIKEAVDSLLEQPEEEELGLGGEEELGGLEGDPGLGGEEELETPDMPPSHTDTGEKLCPCPESEIKIDLSQLAEELGEDVEADEMIDRETELAPKLEENEEDSELDEDFLASILEKLTIDVKNVPSGQPGGGSNETLDRENEEIALAQEEVEELEEDEEKENLKEELKKLGKENETLLEKTNKYKNMLLQLKDKLNEVNLSNAKLLYTNRVLDSASLNERQRNKIVEALSKADSVEGAKVIFETLQSAVGSERKRTPKSLSEAIQRSSTTLPRRKEENKSIPHKDRWKTLAGIK